MSLSKRELLHQVSVLLKYHEHSGIVAYPRNDDITDFLRRDLCFTPKVKTSHSAEKRATPPSVEQKSAPPLSSPNERPSLKEITQEVALCHSCDLHKKRVVPVAGSGGESVRLLIVGDWLRVDKNETKEANALLVLGREEDLMLSRMMAAIQLAEKDYFVTNVIKCGVEESVQPRAENVDACISYLHRQISATAPTLICTMGPVATKALLKRGGTLSQLRGKVFPYRLDDKVNIPVIPTYHPNFLLHNPEMKKATWSDLQAIAKELQKSS